MRPRSGLLLLAACTCSLLDVLANAQESPSRSLTALYQNELAQAVRDLNWKGPKLSDDTLLAVAASGLSWLPKWQSPQLFAGAGKHMRYAADARGRLEGYLAAIQSNDRKQAVPYALSIALDPGDLGGDMWNTVSAFLSGFGDDYDALLMGIEEAPRDLPVLPLYQYAAADLLVWRASPRLIPFFLTMASSRDAYLRSRAIAGLGVAAYDPATGPFQLGHLVPVKPGSVSANQRKMVTDALRRAAADGNYRVRAAAAFAMGLAGGQGDIPFLKMLTRDRAYSLATARFPVRWEAFTALDRLGAPIQVNWFGLAVLYDGKTQTRGQRNVTKDTSEMRKDQICHVPSFYGSSDW